MGYESIVSDGLFGGVQSDVMTAGTGWLAVVAALAGVLLIVRVLTR